MDQICDKKPFYTFFMRPHANSYRFKVGYFGLKFAGDLKNSVDWEVFFFGAYERYGLMLIRDLLQDMSHPVCIDVGANCGVYSMFMSKFSAEVHAFEPDRHALAALKENIAINNISNIFVHDMALGDKNGMLDLYIAKNGDSAWSSFVYGSHKSIYGDPIKVRSTKGDDIIEELRFGRVDRLKIDVEGFERNTLLGLKKTIKRFHPIIFMEFSDFTKKSFKNIDEWNAVMKGYDVYTFKGYNPLLFFFDSQKYKLSRFDFLSCERVLNYVLCLPSQHSNRSLYQVM